MRAEVLLNLKTPILFVQGTRDLLCPLDLLKSVRAQMKAANAVEIVQDGDHFLTVAKRTLKDSGETQTEVEARVIRRIAAFVKNPRH